MTKVGYYLSIYGPQGWIIESLGPMSQLAAEIMKSIVEPDMDDPDALGGCYMVASDKKDECAVVFEAMTDE